MECGICLEENIKFSDIQYLECCHNLCKTCFLQLRKKQCPFCRRVFTSKIKPRKKKKFSLSSQPLFFEEQYDNIIYEDDFIIPTIRPDRAIYRRNKQKQRKKQLMLILLDDELKFQKQSSKSQPNNNHRVSNKRRVMSV